MKSGRNFVNTYKGGAPPIILTTIAILRTRLFARRIHANHKKSS